MDKKIDLLGDKPIPDGKLIIAFKPGVIAGSDSSDEDNDETTIYFSEMPRGYRHAHDGTGLVVHHFGGHTFYPFASIAWYDSQHNSDEYVEAIREWNKAHPDG